MADERGRVFREADWARQMVGTDGWSELVAWIGGVVERERKALEMGVADWSEYQRSIGRISALQEVVARPEELVELANQAMRGDSE